MERTRLPDSLRRHPELSNEVAEFLSGHDVAAVLATVGKDTALVVLAPTPETASIAGVPVGIVPELHLRERAPVIRLVAKFYDVPDDPIMFETFVDAGDPAQRARFAAITDQPSLPILLYDHALVRVDTKHLAIPEESAHELGQLLARAEAWVRSTPRGAYDFEEAKQEVIAETDHPELPYR